MSKKRFIRSILLSVVALAAGVTTAFATNGHPINASSQARITVAIIGDMPYGDVKVAAFPRFIDFLNKDPKVDLVAHVGDIKSGSSLCTDAYFAYVRDELERLKDPVVFTPGDNEWTDCHRANNGNYQPTERLAKLRADYFPVPGETLGVRTKRVLSQAEDPNHSAYVENVIWMESKVLFVTLNVPGSNNDSVTTNPWTGAWAGDLAQAAERNARDAANLAWLTKAFDLAEEHSALGVVLLLQADMWDSFGTHATLNGFDALVNAIGAEANAFQKPVLMVAGDSHLYLEDRPYDGSAFFTSRHPGQPLAPNVQRIIVEGSALPAGRFEYLRLTIDPRSSGLFSWERVPFVFD